MHPHVGDRRYREVPLQGLPVTAVVERHVHPVLGAGVQQAPRLGILPDHPYEVRLRDAVVPGQEIPGIAVVVSPEHVRAEIILPVPVHRQERPPRSVGRQLDRVHRTPLRHVARCDIGPRGAMVSRDMHTSVVSSRPQDAGLQGRFFEREDRPVDLDSRVVHRDRSARETLLCGVVARQVGADGLPAPAAVP